MVEESATSSTAELSLLAEARELENVSDMATRRRIQNRNAQRNFRARQKEAREAQQLAAQSDPTPMSSLPQLQAISTYLSDPAILASPIPQWEQPCDGSDWPPQASQMKYGVVAATVDAREKPQSVSLAQFRASPRSRSAIVRSHCGNRTRGSSSPSVPTDQGKIADANSTGGTALHLAVRCDHSEIVRLLLAHERQQCTVQDDRGQTALHIAAQRGSKEILLELLATEALQGPVVTKLVDFQDMQGQTALAAATEQGHVAIVEELLRAGANPNIEDHTGKTPLHVATLGGDLILVEMLLEGGADIYMGMRT